LSALVGPTPNTKQGHIKPIIKSTDQPVKTLASLGQGDFIPSISETLEIILTQFPMLGLKKSKPREGM
jgi:hypothetical protein